MTARDQARVRVYGASWCEDTARTRRLLRRLGVAHEYRDVDLDLEALREALTLHAGPRRTPIVDLGDRVLAEPPNRTLIEALVRAAIVPRSTALARLKDHNVGDLDRVVRVAIAAAALAATAGSRRVVRWPVRLAAAGLALTAVRAWCPVYDAWEVTSIDGPADHPDGAERPHWLASTAQPLAWSDQ